VFLVLNAGSSSLKHSLFTVRAGELQLVERGLAEDLLGRSHLVVRDAAGEPLEERRFDAPLGHEAATTLLLERCLSRGGARLLGVGHRVVHGGMGHAAPVRVDAALLSDLQALVPLAPLHQPHNLAPMRALLARAPGLPQVACFDTAFHRSQPAYAQRYALPRRITDLGVHRYGFHGLSYEWVASRLPAIDPEAAAGRAVVLHLGNGSSMCALAAGCSVATTMGFTALEGLPMGTRCGSLDPGVILYLMDNLGMDARSLEHLLYHESGLLGVSGVGADMRVLEASADPAAAQAIELYCYRIGRELGSLAAALGGLDAVVFTAGIGENSRRVREAVCRQAAWLGLDFDAAANDRNGPALHCAGSRVRAWVIPTDEEQMIARHTAGLLGA
jgi:acetate kinase